MGRLFSALMLTGSMLLTIMAVPAQAHTNEELDQWVMRWEVQLYWQGGITQDLFMERWDWSVRHPCYFWDECPPPPPHIHLAPRVSNSPAPIPGTSTATQNAEAWRGLVAAHFPADAVNNMLCIMWKESRGNPSADNPNSTARGLFQVLRSWPISFGYTYADLYDPTINTIVARKVWNLQGYGAWTVWPLCR